LIKHSKKLINNRTVFKGKYMKRRREKITYNYECSLSGEQFTLTERASHPKELLSVKAYYEMNPDKDDRPAIVKKKLGIPETSEQKH
jgi:hypothetical protein